MRAVIALLGFLLMARMSRRHAVDRSQQMSTLLARFTSMQVAPLVDRWMSPCAARDRSEDVVRSG